MTAVKGLDANLRIQDRVARFSGRSARPKAPSTSRRWRQIPSSKATGEVLSIERKNRAKELIEDFMIAANGVVARYLESGRFPSIRRVVHAPRRWDRIVGVASERGWTLPAGPTRRPSRRS